MRIANNVTEASLFSVIKPSFNLPTKKGSTTTELPFAVSEKPRA
jgi:hypothetical protein